MQYPHSNDVIGCDISVMRPILPSQGSDGPPPPIAPANFADLPVLLLTKNLLAVYEETNAVFQESFSSTNATYDDGQHNLIVSAGDLLGGRYRLVAELGQGSFGSVYRAVDTGAPCSPEVAGSIGMQPTATTTAVGEVAVKVIKRGRVYRQQGENEVHVLRALRDRMGSATPIVRIHDAFFDRGHICIVTECLAGSLYDLLNQSSHSGAAGLSLTLVKKLGQQILRALAYLEFLGLVHGDLKPENILLVHPRRSAVRLIDFGSTSQASASSDSTPPFYVQSRFYRAPEVILQYGVHPAADVWSAACVLAELHLGEPLFAGIEEVDQIRKQMEVLGPMLGEMAGSSPRHAALFTTLPTLDPQSRDLRVPSGRCRLVRAPPRTDEFGHVVAAPRDEPTAEEYFPSHSKTLLTRLSYKREWRKRMAATPGAAPTTVDSADDYNRFMQLLERMLIWDPKRRISAAEALLDPFFAQYTDIIHSELNQDPEFYRWFIQKTNSFN